VLLLCADLFGLRAIQLFHVRSDGVQGISLLEWEGMGDHEIPISIDIGKVGKASWGFCAKSKCVESCRISIFPSHPILHIVYPSRHFRTIPLP
jgi:hypothetical protein